MKEVMLTNGMIALVDDDDYEKVRAYKWGASTTKISRTTYARCKVKGKTVYMHRIIITIPPGLYTDHRDLNGLNNQKDNLRVCTHRQNHQNEAIRRNKKSIYKGVHWHINKWQARISTVGKRISLGHYEKEADAAVAYNNAAITFFGEFARVNEI